MAKNREDDGRLPSPFPSANTVLELSYPSGVTLPYGVSLWTANRLEAGLQYEGGSVWIGEIPTPAGGRILIGVVDGNVDGLFDSAVARPDPQESASEAGDFACIDEGRHGVLDECLGYEEVARNAVLPGETLVVDGVEVTLVVAPTGHQVELVPTRE